MVMNMNNNNVGRDIQNDDISNIVNILSEEENTGKFIRLMSIKTNLNNFIHKSLKNILNSRSGRLHEMAV